MVEPFRGVERPTGMWRSILLGVVLAGLLAGCSLGGGSGAGGPTTGDSVSVPPASLGKTDVVIQVVSTGNPRRRFGLEVPCPGNNALPAWGVACRAMAREPGRLSNSKVDESCVGGVPGASMRVRGTIAGTRVNLRQSGMCGPPGILAWYRLLKQYPALPDWLRPYV
jgi:hypothetical protein